MHALLNTEPALMLGREDPTSGSRGGRPCSSPSADWLHEQLDGVSEDDLANFFAWHLHTLPFAYKLFVEPRQQPGEEFFGADGEYTQEIHYIHQEAQEFWAASGVDDDIQVLCAHGTDLADRHEKLIPTLEEMFGASYSDEYTIFEHATDIQELIERLPGGYGFPLLTFNAFATDEVDEGTAPSILLGDGYFAFQDAVGLSSEGPEYALTHERAHHLQFTLDAQEDGAGSQDARRHELMADALAAYFLAHNGGGDMAADEIANVHAIAYSVGDCEVANDGHHGTPLQRRCATRWGADLAGSQEDEENLDLSELRDRFDVWYERIDEECAELSYSSASLAGVQAKRYGLQAFAVLAGSALFF
ncbi:hypothetical protein ACHAXT_011944 [Thalassiosira profunda]